MANPEKLAWAPLLHKVAKLWLIEFDSFTLLRDVMNRVYQGINDKGETIIIRFTDHLRRQFADIDVEIQWLNYLNTQNDSFCRPVINSQNAYVETISDGSNKYHVACFYKQNGNEMITQSSTQWGKGLFHDMGKLTGLLHRLTSKYEITKDITRHTCLQETVFQNLADFQNMVPDKMLEAIQHLLLKLEKVPSNTHYGLVHGDIKQDNFFYTKDNQLFLYDFDQSCKSWHIYDLVVSLYFNYFYPLCRIANATEDDVKIYLNTILEGYHSEHVLDSNQLTLIPDLLSLREVLIYLILKRVANKPDVANSPLLKRNLQDTYAIMEQRTIMKEAFYQFSNWQN